uniref:Uncharacterized protein n=1 Tax=Daphnia magna TaxID=35525 RepID=A0A0P5E702_9CRUS
MTPSKILTLHATFPWPMMLSKWQILWLQIIYQPIGSLFIRRSTLGKCFRSVVFHAGAVNVTFASTLWTGGHLNIPGLSR